MSLDINNKLGMFDLYKRQEVKNNKNTIKIKLSFFIKNIPNDVQNACQ